MAMVWSGDGPAGRVADAVNRECSRLVSALAGVVMLAPVYHLDPGTARQICATFAGVLLVRASWPRRNVHPDSQATMRDLVELEKSILATREDIDQRAEAFGERLDGITDLVVEIGDQVR